MPIHKTKIFNTTIDISYEKNDKNKLLDLISNLNNRIKKFSELSGKVSDIKIVILAALAIEDELAEINNTFSINKSLEGDINKSNLKIEKLNSEIVSLKDKLGLLESELAKKNHDDEIKENQIDKLTNELELLNKSILTIYNE